MATLRVSLTPRLRRNKRRGERFLSADASSTTTVAAAKSARLKTRLEKCISSPPDAAAAIVFDKKGPKPVSSQCSVALSR